MKMTNLLITLLVFVSFPSHAELEWIELPDMPVGKWEAGTTTLDGIIYVMGGYAAGVKSTKISHTYNPADGSWTTIQDMPSAISHMNLVLDNRTIWFAGGFKDGYKGHAIAEVWSYDIDLDRYTAAPLLPELRAGGGLALVGRNLHYIGGLKADRDTDSGDHWVLDLEAWKNGAASWTAAPPLPLPRNQFSCVSIGDKIYAIGGQLNHDSRQLDQDRVDIYDTITKTWSVGPALPKPHSHGEAGTFVHKGRIYMVGGHTTIPGDRKKIGPDVLAFTPGESWERIGRLPRPLSSPAAAIVGGKLYVAGGSPNGSRVQANMWVADLP